jgi:3-oxoacyl-[acyl-carrier-protein] synthase II
MSRRVVITGAGTVNPLASTLDAFASSLLEGKCGVRALTVIDPSGLPVRIGGEVRDFDARQYLDKKDRKSLKLMVRTHQLAVAAARLARDHAGLSVDAIDPERFGTSLGSGTVSADLADLGPASRASFDFHTGRVCFDKWGRDGLSLIPPMWMLNHVPNMAACHVAIVNDCRGPNNTITLTDESGLSALGEAYRIVRRGRADAMLAGGAETRINPISLARNVKFGHLVAANDDPARACRPFDRDRTGIALGEGSTVLVLESLDHANRRGARPLAEVCAFGCGMDVGCKGAGLARVIRDTLNKAGIRATELDHVNANAGGWVDHDAWEARALREAIGDVPVVAYKGALSNLGSAAGPTELIASVLALQIGRLAATLNCDKIAADCPVNVVRAPRPVTKPFVLKISGTDRGQCAAILVRRWKD